MKVKTFDRLFLAVVIIAVSARLMASGGPVGYVQTFDCGLHAQTTIEQKACTQ